MAESNVVTAGLIENGRIDLEVVVVVVQTYFGRLESAERHTEKN